MRPIRVLIVDDHPVMRVGLRTLLSAEAAVEVVGESDTAFGALELTKGLHPHVVVIGAGMPVDRVELLARRLREAHPAAKVVFLLDRARGTGSGELPLGGDAYLLADFSREDLIAAVTTVASGQPFVDAEFTGKLLQERETAARELVRHRLGLTDQEVELLRSLANGATNQEIAGSLYLSEVSVTRKIQQVIAKLGAANRTQAVAEAVRRCII